MSRIPRRSSQCPIEDCAQLLGKPWNAKLIWYLLQREYRFGELMTAMGGISAKILTLRLKELEEAGLVERCVNSNERPPLVTYHLTALGRSFEKVLDAMSKVKGLSNKK